MVHSAAQQPHSVSTHLSIAGPMAAGSCSQSAGTNPFTQEQTQFVHVLERGKRCNSSQPLGATPACEASLLGEHFDQCINHDLPLFSFHSPLGHKKCLDLINGTNLAKSDPRCPTALQILLGSGFSESNNQKKMIINTESKGRLLLVLNKGDVQEVRDGMVPCIQATVRVFDQMGNELKPVEIFEMAPGFDGHALTSDNLSKCYVMAKSFFNHSQSASMIKSDPTAIDQLFGQFASARGSLRSASLLVMSQFESYLQSVDPKFWPCNSLAVELKIHEFIAAGRSQNVNFLPGARQQQELVSACFDLLNTKKEMAEQFALHGQPPELEAQ